MDEALYLCEGCRRLVADVVVVEFQPVLCPQCRRDGKAPPPYTPKPRPADVDEADTPTPATAPAPASTPAPVEAPANTTTPAPQTTEARHLAVLKAARHTNLRLAQKTDLTASPGLVHWVTAESMELSGLVEIQHLQRPGRQGGKLERWLVISPKGRDWLNSTAGQTRQERTKALAQVREDVPAKVPTSRGQYENMGNTPWLKLCKQLGGERLKTETRNQHIDRVWTLCLAYHKAQAAASTAAAAPKPAVAREETPTPVKSPPTQTVAPKETETVTTQTQTATTPVQETQTVTTTTSRPKLSVPVPTTHAAYEAMNWAVWQTLCEELGAPKPNKGETRNQHIDRVWTLCQQYLAGQPLTANATTPQPAPTTPPVKTPAKVSAPLPQSKQPAQLHPLPAEVLPTAKPEVMKLVLALLARSVRLVEDMQGELTGAELDPLEKALDTLADVLVSKVPVSKPAAPVGKVVPADVSTPAVPVTEEVAFCSGCAAEVTVPVGTDVSTLKCPKCKPAPVAKAQVQTPAPAKVNTPQPQPQPQAKPTTKPAATQAKPAEVKPADAPTGQGVVEQVRECLVTCTLGSLERGCKLAKLKGYDRNDGDSMRTMLKAWVAEQK